MSNIVIAFDIRAIGLSGEDDKARPSPASTLPHCDQPRRWLLCELNTNEKRLDQQSIYRCLFSLNLLASEFRAVYPREFFKSRRHASTFDGPCTLGSWLVAYQPISNPFVTSFGKHLESPKIGRLNAFRVAGQEFLGKRQHTDLLAAVPFAIV